MCNQKLLIVYSNLGLGGIPTKIVDIVNRMAIICPEISIDILIFKERQFSLIPDIKNRNTHVCIYHHLSKLGFIIWVWKHMLIHKPNSVLSFISPYSIPVLLGKCMLFWRKTKVIVSEDHYTSQIIRTMSYPMIQKIGIMLFYRRANAVITPSGAVKNDLVSTFKVPENKITVIRNWTKYSSSTATGIKRIYDVLYVGRIEKTKHVMDILQIIYQVKKHYSRTLSCRIIGEGSEVSACAEYIRSHGLQKHVRILKPQRDISGYLYRSKIMMFIPDFKSEGFPISLLDAMACGTLVLTRSFDGVSEVITDNQTGLIVPSNDTMEAVLIHVFTQHRKYQPIIHQAKQWVSQHNSEANIDRYIAYIHDK